MSRWQKSKADPADGPLFDGAEASREAYHAACASGLIPIERLNVLNVLHSHGPGTARELEDSAGRTIRDITPRLSELRAQGVAEVIDTRPCKVVTKVKTPRQVWAFKAGPVKPFVKPEEWKTKDAWLFVVGGKATEVSFDEPAANGVVRWLPCEIRWRVPRE